MTNKIINKLKSLNRKKLFIITSIILFPITIVFSPIIILLLDIISKQRLILDRLESPETKDNSYLKVSEILENIMILLTSKGEDNNK